MDKINKNDFVEIEFTAKVKDTNDIFDTNNKEDAKNAGLDEKSISPLIVCVGKSMTVKGMDQKLEGKEIGKAYSEEYTPEESFGKRNSTMVRMIPLRVFLEQKIMPERGMQLSLDNMLVKILSVSGGRVLVDFNHPIAGKNVIYDFTIKRKIDDLNEKINALQEFFFRTKFAFRVDNQKKEILFNVPDNVGQYLKIFEKQFDDILGFKISSEAPKEIVSKSETSSDKIPEKKAE